MARSAALPGADSAAPHRSSFSRRSWLIALASCVCWLPLAAAAGEPVHAEGAAPLSAEESLARLKEGNQRFVDERPKHDHESSDWRRRLVTEQHPFAVIVGCSDSRVPPELIFDQGFGDLFVIRNAGNLMATDVLASVEYAAIHLHTRLVVVLGHEGCGAVTAALHSRKEREREPMELQATLNMIDVALEGVPLPQDAERAVPKAVEHNVRWAVKQLHFLAAERGVAALGSAKVIGAVYELQTGKVRFLE